jgi:acyl carrier protein
MTEVALLKERIKRVIIDRLRLPDLEPQQIQDHEPLFGEGLGLDSVDALELVVGLEKEFQVKIAGEAMDRSVFASVQALAEFVATKSPGASK